MTTQRGGNPDTNPTKPSGLVYIDKSLLSEESHMSSSELFKTVDDDMKVLHKSVDKPTQNSVFKNMLNIDSVAVAE